MTTTPANANENGLPRWAKQAIALGIVFALLAGIILVLDLAAAQRWRRYEAVLRDKGQPITFAEIEARRTVIPDERNSALVIEGMVDDIQAIDRSVPGRLPLLVFGRGSPTANLQIGIPRYMLQPSREFVDDHSHVLEGLAPILDMPSGRYPIDFQQPTTDIILPDLAHLRTAAKLSRLAATVSLIDGDFDRASERIALQFRLADSLHDEPTVISRLVQIAIQASAARSIEDTLRVGNPSGAVLDRLSDEVESALASGTMKWALLGERAYFVKTCDLLAAGELGLSSIQTGAESGDGPPPGLVWAISWLIRSNQVTGAQMLTWLIDAADDPPALRAAARKINVKVPKLPKTQFIVRMTVPSLHRTVELHLKITARLRCVQAAIAAERFRMREGHLPGSLDELVPDSLGTIPVDPFDGRPMRFATTEDGIVVYSVAENLRDDGGDVAERTRARERAPDVGFRLFLAERREVLLTDEPPPDEN